MRAIVARAVKTQATRVRLAMSGVGATLATAFLDLLLATAEEVGARAKAAKKRDWANEMATSCPARVDEMRSQPSRSCGGGGVSIQPP